MEGKMYLAFPFSWAEKIAFSNTWQISMGDSGLKFITLLRFHLNMIGLKSYQNRKSTRSNQDEEPAAGKNWKSDMKYEFVL